MSMRKERTSSASDGVARMSPGDYRFRALIEHGSDAITVLDSQGQFL